MAISCAAPSLDVTWLRRLRAGAVHRPRVSVRDRMPERPVNPEVYE